MRFSPSRWWFALVVLVVAIVTSATHAGAAPSGELGSVLSSIRDLFSSDFGHLVDWAKHDAPMPENPVFSLEKTEAAIDDLNGDDRDAVLSWLRGNGRSKLHDRGASDADIGPTRGRIESAPATPNPYRSIPLASDSLDAAPQQQLQILGGFAAVKKDGTGAVVCISFKNLDARVAHHVVVDFPVLGEGGAIAGTLTLDRTGEFSPNVDIHSFASLSAWQSGMGPRSQNDGCVVKNLPTAAIPLLQARAVGYKVTRVEY
jgi:hypothetical protein